MKFKNANRIAPDDTPRFAASHLGLVFLAMSHKNDERLIWVKPFTYCSFVLIICFLKKKEKIEQQTKFRAIKC